MVYLLNDYDFLEKVVEECEAKGTFHSPDWQKKVPLSVLVSVYNQEEQLRKMLLALAQQTYSPENFEVVIIDDGSRKETFLDYVARQDFQFNLKYIWQVVMRELKKLDAFGMVSADYKAVNLVAY
ncbi:MAG TPA: glycosyltransferase [Candidatus Nanoarchaeia archaeon]|nr:glycosyltransferase [Candidatus Nanoarchaeia archaeon]